MTTDPTPETNCFIHNSKLPTMRINHNRDPLHRSAQPVPRPSPDRGTPRAIYFEAAQDSGRSGCAFR